MKNAETARPGSGAGLPSTGGDAQRQIARMRAHLIARYKLVAVQGRPEELEHPNGRRVSLGYGSKTIRVRLQEGRDWKERHDFQIAEGWGAVLYAMCDPWFAQLDPKPGMLDIGAGIRQAMGISETRHHAAPEEQAAGRAPVTERRPRPIRDNPQA